MLACDFYLVPRCPHKSQSVRTSVESASQISKAGSWWIRLFVRRPSIFDIYPRLHSHITSSDAANR